MASSVQTTGAPQGGVMLPPTKEAIEAKFDLAIALSLSSWSALTLAVQNLWGGPDSAEKRDWFAGAISELFASTPLPDMDVDYLEEFMLQVMVDEFDINVDDQSGEEVAAKIVGLRKQTLDGDFRLVNEMLAKWEDKKRKGGDKVKAQFVERGEDDDDTDWDSDDVEDIDEDTERGEASQAPRIPKEKPAPEIDDDGFTKVVSKKRR